MSPDNNCSGHVQVELRIKAMQPVLIPGLVSVLTGIRARWYVPNKLRAGAIALDLGLVGLSPKG